MPSRTCCSLKRHVCAWIWHEVVTADSSQGPQWREMWLLEQLRVERIRSAFMWKHKKLTKSAFHRTRGHTGQKWFPHPLLIHVGHWIKPRCSADGLLGENQSPSLALSCFWQNNFMCWTMAMRFHPCFLVPVSSTHIFFHLSSTREPDSTLVSNTRTGVYAASLGQISGR